jgi:hypothetical protein
MFLPAEYLWLEPVLIASAVVFVISLIGNVLAFWGRVANAFVTALIFAAVFGALVFYGYGNISMTVSTTPSITAPANK